MLLFKKLRSTVAGVVNMPPALSDDEASDIEPRVSIGPQSPRNEPNSAPQDFEGYVSEEVEVKEEGPATNGAAMQRVTSDIFQSVAVEEEEEDDESMDEDVYIIEAIKNHMVDRDGTLKFQVKWEGYEKKEDMTWEPEDNLKETATEILDEYLQRIGGRDSIFEESEKAARGKKRSRAAGGTPAGATKRSRKSGGDPADSTPPTSMKKWSPPAGSWEDEIEAIDACEDEGSQKLVVYLIWKNGQKTKHETPVIYKKCPQKMLQYYERHVKIIRDENRASVD